MSAVRTWLGGSHDFFAANAWTPTGQPMAGDTALIQPGTGSNPNVAAIQNAWLDNLSVLLDDGLGSADPGASPTLTLSNVFLNGGTSIMGHSTFGYNPVQLTETVALEGFIMNQGSIGETGFGNTLNVTLADSTLLLNQGTMSAVDFDNLNVQGSGWNVLVNNGTISGHGSTIDVGTPVFGQGGFDLTPGSGGPGSHFPHQSTLEFQQMVGSGQTISMTDSTLVLDSPATFLATIDDLNVGIASPFSGNSSVLLAGQPATSLAFQNDVLTVFNGNNVLAQLGFAPGLTEADFAFNAITGGGGLPAGTDIHIQLPDPGTASTQTAQTASLTVQLPSHA